MKRFGLKVSLIIDENGFSLKKMVSRY